MLPDMRGYLQLASALAAAGAGKATETVSTLMALGDRDALVALVRTEVDQVIGRMGLVREDELAALRRQVERLQAQVDQAQVKQASAEQVQAVAKPAATASVDASEPSSETAGEAAVQGTAAEKPKKRKRPVADA